MVNVNYISKSRSTYENSDDKLTLITESKDQ